MAAAVLSPRAAPTRVVRRSAPRPCTTNSSEKGLEIKATHLQYRERSDRKLAVTIKLDSLNAESSRHQSQVTALMRLIAVKTTLGSPLTIYIRTLVNSKDADQRISSF